MGHAWARTAKEERPWVRAWERRCHTASETEEGRRESQTAEEWESGVRRGEVRRSPACCSSCACRDEVNDGFAGDIDDIGHEREMVCVCV